MPTTQTHPTTTDATIELDRNLARFLRTVRTGQSINLAAWAARLIRADRLTEADLTRCFALGFEIN